MVRNMAGCENGITNAYWKEILETIQKKLSKCMFYVHLVEELKISMLYFKLLQSNVTFSQFHGHYIHCTNPNAVQVQI